MFCVIRIRTRKSLNNVNRYWLTSNRDLQFKYILEPLRLICSKQRFLDLLARREGGSMWGIGYSDIECEESYLQNKFEICNWNFCRGGEGKINQIPCLQFWNIIWHLRHKISLILNSIVMENVLLLNLIYRNSLKCDILSIHNVKKWKYKTLKITKKKIG